jgi:periplasmic divalent cation tolerance protein
MSEVCQVTITAPEVGWLTEFVSELLDKRLCAGTHIDSIESAYWWSNEINRRPEGRLILHTRMSLVSIIVGLVNERHPYQVPCVVTTPISDGNPEYINWILAETSAAFSERDVVAYKESEYMYTRIADSIRHQILGDKLAPGASLPTQANIAKEYSVSGIVVRRAFDILEAEGLISRGQGAQATVRPREPSLGIRVLIQTARHEEPMWNAQLEAIKATGASYDSEIKAWFFFVDFTFELIARVNDLLDIASKFGATVTLEPWVPQTAPSPDSR